jgi:predicted component of type VI protein secretion system
MEADRAVEDAFLDLQSHQVATLKAIPGALRATLDRFSPGSIRRRRGNDLGFMAKLLPAFRDAALWRHYEREFVAVKKESDEAFMEVFAKEFRKAYERQLREGIK